jgi:Domain of unknown function (DUF4126)
MLELLTGTGLAISAGLNAYIPLLAVGLAGRFLDFIELPAAWAWLENSWVLWILAALLVIEVIADKIPIIDSVNDWVHTIIRPAAGGLAFGSGSTATTIAVPDPAEFFSSNQWVPIALGVLIALGVHLTKAAARPVINAVTVGTVTPLVSAAEDAGSVVVSALALIIPVLVIAVIPVALWLIWLIVRRRRNGRPPKREPAVSVQSD